MTFCERLYSPRPALTVNTIAQIRVTGFTCTSLNFCESITQPKFSVNRQLELSDFCSNHAKMNLPPCLPSTPSPSHRQYWTNTESLQRSSSESGTPWAASLR